MIGLLAAAVAALYAGCGGATGAAVVGHGRHAGEATRASPSRPAAATGAPAASHAHPAFDPRDDALTCIHKKGVAAHKVGAHRVRVGRSLARPLIVFTSSPQAAVTASLRGSAQGAEQIGDTLLYVNRGPEGVLSKVEACLDENDG